MVNFVNCSVHGSQSILNWSCGGGDRALQECNLSTHVCPCIAGTMPRKRRPGFLFHPCCNHGTMRKTHLSPLFSLARPLLQPRRSTVPPSLLPLADMIN